MKAVENEQKRTGHVRANGAVATSLKATTLFIWPSKELLSWLALIAAVVRLLW